MSNMRLLLLLIKSASLIHSTPRAGQTKKLHTHENSTILNFTLTSLVIDNTSQEAVQKSTDDCSDPFNNPKHSRCSHTLMEMNERAEPESISVWSGYPCTSNGRNGHSESLVEPKRKLSGNKGEVTGSFISPLLTDFFFELTPSRRILDSASFWPLAAKADDQRWFTSRTARWPLWTPQGSKRYFPWSQAEFQEHDETCDSSLVCINWCYTNSIEINKRAQTLCKNLIVTGTSITPGTSDNQNTTWRNKNSLHCSRPSTTGSCWMMSVRELRCLW